MKVSVPKEVRPGERRVAATPETVARLMKLGFEVVIETCAGEKASFSDLDYERAGARIAKDSLELWENADIVVRLLDHCQDHDVGVVLVENAGR